MTIERVSCNSVIIRVNTVGIIVLIRRNYKCEMILNCVWRGQRIFFLMHLAEGKDHTDYVAMATPVLMA